LKEDSSTICWNNIGEEWAKFSENNDYRNYFIMPYTINLIGDIGNKKILDLGCGEGEYSRKLARKGADVTGIDCSYKLIEIAKTKSKEENLNINYLVRNSCNLENIKDNAYDIVLSSMMLMDCEDLKGTVSEIYRILKPKGRLFASILHPCFSGQAAGWNKDDCGNQFFKITDYFNPKIYKAKINNEFSSSAVFRHRTLEDYFKIFLKHKFILVDYNEPVPDKKQTEISYRIARLAQIPLFLFMEWAK